MIGEYARADNDWDECWRFRSVDGRKTLTVNDIRRELFENGMGGNIYAVVIKVPEEFPLKEDDEDYIDVIDDWQAAELFADACHYKLTDSLGKVVN